MGFRFGKSIRLGKLFRLNISKSGIGLSAGIKGFRVSSGSRGARVTASIPGTGVSFSQSLAGSATGSKGRVRSSKPLPAQEYTTTAPQPPSPGWFASAHEKAFHKGLTAFQQGKHEDALRHFLEAARKDSCAAVFAGLLSSQNGDQRDTAVTLLEAVVASDTDFPTPLMKKYIASAEMQLRITNEVQAIVPMNGFGATLLLAELYQRQNRVAEAIGVLEALSDLMHHPVLTLSLCDLYAEATVWDGILRYAEKVPIIDDVTLQTAILRGRALQNKNFHDAAIEVLTDSLRKKKGLDPDLLNEARYWRAISYEAVGKKSLANKQFQMLYAEVPRYRDVAQRLIP
jgi:tetratricopeptide (TPR) repeat protein